MPKPAQPTSETNAIQLRDAKAGSPLMSAAPLDESDLARLAWLLEELPEPAQPLELSALDGYLCGVLLQPRRPAPAEWLSYVTDIEGRAVAIDAQLMELHALVQRRFAEVDQAIGQRQWFDPWVMAPAADGATDEAEHNDAGEPADPDQPDNSHIGAVVLPWITGFACAMENFPELMAMTDLALVEPLALLFLHFDADDLEDADALLAMIETLEPPTDLAEAVQDIVRALMLIADVSRPLQAAAQTAPGSAPRSAAGAAPGARRGKAGAPRQAHTRTPAGRGKPRR